MTITCKPNRTLVILVVLALCAAVGVLLLFLGCALDFKDGDRFKNVNWWGIFVLLFYLISPIPLALVRQCASQDIMSIESLNIAFDISYFISACIVVSGYGLPIILARQKIIQGASAALIAAANTFSFGTIYSFFVFFGRNDEDSDWTTF